METISQMCQPNLKAVLNLQELLKRLESNHEQGMIFILADGEEQFLSYAALAHKARMALGYLQKQGLEKGDFLVFQVSEAHPFLVSFWACLLGGIIPVPLQSAYNKANKEKLRGVLGQLGKAFLLVEEKRSSALEKSEGLREISLSELAAWDELGASQEVSHEDTAFIQFSSGSIGSPKGVVLSHANLLSNLNAMILGTGLSSKDCSLSWMPLTHDMGLIGFHLTPLAAGVPQVLMQPGHFVRNPLAWLDAAQKHRASLLGAPNFGYRHLLQAIGSRPPRWDLSSVRLCFNGAEPISAELCRAFTTQLAPTGLDPKSMFPVYGMAEACLAVTFPTPGAALQTTNLERSSPGKAAQPVEFVVVGRAVQDASVRICDSKGCELPEGKIGQIQLKGAMLTKGYFRNPEENAKAFSADGWFRSGDLGLIREGQLTVTGREKEVLFSRGLNLYAFDVERVVEELAEVGKGKTAVCQLPATLEEEEQLVLFVQTRKGLAKFATLAEQIKAHLGQTMGLDLGAVLPVNKIPRTTSGKLRRFVLEEQFREGAFREIKAQLAALSPHGTVEKGLTYASLTEEKLAKFWENVLGVKQVKSSAHFFELGGDSIKAGHLALQVARGFSKRLSLETIFRQPKLAEMAAWLDGTEPQSLTELKKSAPQVQISLTSEQERLYFQQRLNPEQLENHVYKVLEVKGPLDLNRLSEALQTLVARHEILRTRFQFHKGAPRMEVLESLSVAPLELGPCEDWEEAVRASFKVFNLETPPLFRLFLLTQGPTTILVFEFHHIICDGTSLGIFIEELFAHYEQRRLQEPFYQYRDYALWQQAFRWSADMQKQEAFWLEYLACELPRLELKGTEQKSPLQNGQHADGYELLLTQAMTNALKALAHRNGTTLGLTVLAAFHALLAKYTGEQRIVTGLMMEGRNHQGLEDLMGMFVKTHVVKSEICADTTFSDLLATIKSTFLGIHANQDYPFDHLVHRLEKDRDPDRHPIFDFGYVYQNFSQPRLQVHGHPVRELPFLSPTVPFDLLLEASDAGPNLACCFYFRTKRFSLSRIMELAHHFKRLLEEVIRFPELCLKNLQILSHREKLHLRQFNHSTLEPQTPSSILATFQQWSQDEERIYLKTAEKNWTYAEVERLSNRLAKSLLSKGVGPETRVGLVLGRNHWYPITTLAVWKAGGAYVPIPPELPEARQRYIAQNARLALVIHQTELEWMVAFPRLNLDHWDPAEASDLALETKPEPSQLAYILFTSGSTGYPKGILVEHRHLHATLMADQSELPLRAEDCCLVQSAFSFDSIFISMYQCFFVGASIYLANEELRSDPRALHAVIQGQDITHLNVSPAGLAMLCERSVEPQENVKYIIVGGESYSEPVLRKAFQLFPQAQIFNFYGPTETTIHALYQRLTPEMDLSIQVLGKPIRSATIYIVNSDMQWQPIGVPGEICVGGLGVSRGYIDEKLNEGKFVFAPFSPRERLYRSGDIGRWLADGKIEFLGRRDHQIQLRGYRIELGEIESVLLSFTGLNKALVLGQKDKQGEPFLCCWYSGDQPISPLELSQFLAGRLPDYMVPTFFVQVENFPLHLSGKVDLKALPAPGSETLAKQALVAPRTELEKQLALQWQQALGIDSIGIDDHFFRLGGHSLLATKVMDAIDAETGVPIGLKALFQFPTIRLLAEQIEAKAQSTGALLSFQNPISEDLVRHARLSGRRYRVGFQQTDADSQPYSPHYLLDANLRTQANALAEEEEPLWLQLLNLQSTFNDDLADIRESLMLNAAQQNQIASAAPVLRRFLAGQHPKWFLKRNFRSVILAEFEGTRAFIPERVWEALNQLVAEQELLRSRIRADEEGFQFEVLELPQLPPPVCVDLTAYQPECQQRVISQLAGILREQLEAVSPLEHQLLFQALVFKLNLQDYRIFVAFDHIIGDHECARVICDHFKHLNHVQLKGNFTLGSVEVEPYRVFSELTSAQMNDPKILVSFQNSPVRELIRVVKPLRELLGEAKAQVFSNPVLFLAEPRLTGEEEMDAMAMCMLMAVCALRLHFQIEEVPLRVLVSRRHYRGLNFYNTVGDFHDSVPVVFPGELKQPAALAARFRESDAFFAKEGIFLSSLGQDYEVRLHFFNAPFNFNFVGQIGERELEETVRKAAIFKFVSYPLFAFRKDKEVGVLFFHGLAKEQMQALEKEADTHFSSYRFSELEPKC